MSPEHPSPSAVSPDVVAEGLAAVRRSKPEDYDGHKEFERLTPDARLTWLESAVRFVQAGKEVSRPRGSSIVSTRADSPGLALNSGVGTRSALGSWSKKEGNMVDEVLIICWVKHLRSKSAGLLLCALSVSPPIFRVKHSGRIAFPDD